MAEIWTLLTKHEGPDSFPQSVAAPRTVKGDSAQSCDAEVCGIGSWGGWCLSLAPYVTVTGATDGATASVDSEQVGTGTRPAVLLLGRPRQHACVPSRVVS